MSQAVAASAPSRHAHLEVILTQLGLLFFTGLGIFLVGLPKTSPYQRWGYLLALLGQFIWFYLSLRDFKKSWGMFFLTIFCTIGWAQGLWVNLVSPMTNPPAQVTSVSAPGTVHRKLEAVDP